MLIFQNISKAEKRRIHNVSNAVKQKKNWHFISDQPSESNDFCYDHIVKTFSHYPIQICPQKSDSIQCSGAKHSKNMAFCKLWNFSISPNEIIGVFPSDTEIKAMSDFTANLIGNKSCLRGSVKQLIKRIKSPVPTKFIKVIYLRLVIMSSSRRNIFLISIKSLVSNS